MISDKYILNVENEEMLLDITEHMAASYGFSSKDLFKIRLITEEMITSVQSGMVLAPGEMWFGARNGMFAVTVSVQAGSRGISPEQREKLLQAAASSKKSQIFGFIQKFFDEMASADENMSFTGFVQANFGETDGNSWSIDTLSRLTVDSSQDEKLELMEAQDLEIRLIKGFADEIRVTDRQEMLEMSVFKKIPGEFTDKLIFLNH